MDISEDPVALRRILQETRRIAVVGCSLKPKRDSHQVARYLIEAGYEVIPVNPGHDRILDRPCYPDLSSIPGKVDIVDIFRRPEHVPVLIEEAIALRAGTVWMQQEAGNPEAARRASEAGLNVVIEKCIRVVHTVLQVGPRPK